MPTQHYVQHMHDGGAAMREREAELRARLTQGICQMCEKPVPEDRKLGKCQTTPAKYCSVRCRWCAKWASYGQMSIERAKELSRVPAGFVAQIAREQNAAKKRKPIRYSCRLGGQRGGAKTAERGREYYAELGRKGGRPKGSTPWNAVAIPTQVANGTQ